jgi:hypothetical protein
MSSPDPSSSPPSPSSPHPLLASRTAPLVVLACLACFTAGYMLALGEADLGPGPSRAVVRPWVSTPMAGRGGGGGGGAAIRAQPPRRPPAAEAAVPLTAAAADAPSSSSSSSSAPPALTVVITRHKEDIGWASHLTRPRPLLREGGGGPASASASASPPFARVVVFNDGPALDRELSKGMDVRDGDHLPSESTKYLTYIIDNYDLQQDSSSLLSPWTLFTQADPFVHAPDFIGLLHASQYWVPPCQILSYRAHGVLEDGRQWGPWAELYAEQWRDRFIPSTHYRVWYEEMDDTFQGRVFHDPFIADYIHPQFWDVDPDAPKPFRVSTLWEHLGIPTPLPRTVYKAYAAIFGVSEAAIRRHPKAVYERIRGWLNVSDPGRNKARAIAVEYLWPALFGLGGEG